MDGEETNDTSDMSGFLRLQQVLELIPVGRSTWWSGVKSGRYPPGIKIGPRVTAWPVSSIRKLIAELEGQAHTADYKKK